jgi:hypothetical protein
MKVGKFLSNFLKVADVKKAQTVTISDVKAQELGQGDDKEKKLVLYFEELDQGLVLNKGSIALLVEECGEESDEWIGEQFELYKDPNVTFGC